MKKLFFSLAAVVAIVAGCAKETIDTKAVNEDGTYNFKAVIADKSKTSIDDEGNMAWVEGDQISVYDGSFHDFTIQEGFTSEEAIFLGELENPSAASLAVCPAGIGVDVAGEIVEFILPSEYTYDGQSTHAVMFATGFGVNDRTNLIEFKHLGGLFKVTYNNVPQEAKTFCFEATKQIAGEFTIDYVNNPVLKVAESGSGKSVSYTIASTDDHASMSFYVPVPVGTFGFNICLKDGEGNKIAGSSKTKSEFEIGLADYVNIPAIELPDMWVENFNNTKVGDTKVGASSNFSTQGNTSGFNYEWSSNGSVYVFHNGIRLGSGSATGSVNNSTILSDVSAGPFTVKIFAAVWNTDGGKISVTYNGTTLEASPKNTSISSPSTTEYSAADFEKATEFVFNKVQGVNEIIIGSTQKRIIIDKIEIVEGGVLPEPFSVSTESLTPAWDDIEATFDITAGNNVNWTIGAVEGLTFSNSSGNGNATITVSFARNEEETQLQKEILVSTNYESVEGEKEYTISFTQAGKPTREMDGEGTVEKPYSVADALYLAGNLADNGTTAECYVTGTITALGTFKNGTYSYTIGTGDDTFEVYSGKDLGEVNFESESDIAIDQVVVIYGKIKKYVNYKSETTLEMDGGNYLYSINGATSILKGIAVSGQKTSFTQNEEWAFGGTVTASYRGKDDADVTSSTTFSGYNTANTGEQTVTASYSENEVNKTTDYTISVVKEGTVQITKVTAVSQFTPGKYIILTYDQAGYVPNAVATSKGSVLYKAVTKTDGAINITRDMVWTATGDGGSNGLTFESYANSGKYLWGSNDNNGIRVTDNLTSSGASNVWTLVNDTSYGQRGTFGSSRYLSTYGTQDWRCYTSTSTTNKAANFFKIEGWVDPGVTKHTLTINSATNGSIKATVDNEEVESGAQIEEGKTVTITATPDENYEFDEWNVTGATVGSSSTQTFTMTGDVTVGATFKEKQSGGGDGDKIPVGTILWSETWTGASTGTSANDSYTPSANYGKGTTVYNNGSVTYSQSANSVYVRNEDLASGDKPELILSSGKTWTISNINVSGTEELSLTYLSNNTKSSVTCTDATISGSSKSYTINTKDKTSITLVFGCSGNTRIDNVVLKVTK